MKRISFQSNRIRCKKLTADHLSIGGITTNVRKIINEKEKEMKNSRNINKNSAAITKAITALIH